MLAKLLKEEVTKGKVYDLGMPYHAEMPLRPGPRSFAFSVVRRHRDAVAPDVYSSCVASFSMFTHTGTHIDALGHVSGEGKLFGGLRALDVETPEGGLSKLGIDEAPPLVTRGVLLDVARLRDTDILPADYEVTVADLKGCLRAAGARIRAGDAVFIRTGWARYFGEPARYLAQAAPGPGVEVVQWLAGKKIRLTGSDTPAYEKTPVVNWPVHIALLAKNGIYIMEWMNLEPLSEAGVSTFVSVVLPLKIVGACGSPVRPIAIK